MRLLHPVDRVGRLEELANALAFLLPKEASFSTGAILPADGSQSALRRDPEKA